MPLREDWEQIKDDIMPRAAYAKFTQNKNIRDILMSTGKETIIEKTTNKSSKYTSQFENIANKYELDLDDS